MKSKDMQRGGLLALVGGIVALVTAAPPLYQIDVTQKGFAQFLEYDVAVPPLSEFTFCVRLRTTDLSSHQPIFTYLVYGNKPLISLWLESGGGNVHMSLRGPADSVDQVAPVDWPVGVWRQLCFSWQSDSGAWALYQDGRLLICAASNKLIGYVFPGGGNIVLGYGFLENSGYKNGWEGNIYDFNMILSSTIARNNSVQHSFRPKKQPNKKILERDNFRYVILSDLDAEHTNEVQESDSEYIKPLKKGRSYVKFMTPYSNVEHEVGIDLKPRPPFVHMITPKTMKQDSIKPTKPHEPKFFVNSILPNHGMSMLWKIINKAGTEGKFKIHNTDFHEQSEVGTKDLLTLSEFETPPPLSDPASFKMITGDFLQPKIQIEGPFNAARDETLKNQQNKNKLYTKIKTEIVTSVPLPTLSETETPPSLERDNRVFGHWTGNTFAEAVLGYIKDKKNYRKPVPKTIPLKRITDNYPYASEPRIVSTFPFELTMNRRKNVPKVFDIIKRYARSPEINVQIMRENIRTKIAQKHAKERAVNVEVSHRGEVTNEIVPKVKESQYKGINNLKNSNQVHPDPFRLTNHNIEFEYDDFYIPNVNNKVNSIEPLQSSFLNINLSLQPEKTNKWHNMQSLNNDFPLREEFHRNIGTDSLRDNIFSDNIDQQSLPRVSFQHSPLDARARELNKGRAIAYEVSKRANGINSDLPAEGNVKYSSIFFKKNSDTPKTNNVSILNHEPYEMKTIETVNAYAKHQYSNNEVNTFHKAVKLGNTLNEHLVIGKDKNDKKKSFLGGDDKIPDIHRHRSDIDENEYGDQTKVPPSLSPRICDQEQSTKHKLYVKPDGSIDLTQIYSPFKQKSPGLKLMAEHYDSHCTSSNVLQNHTLMLVEWKHTPIRIFGGGKLRKKHDLC